MPALLRCLLLFAAAALVQAQTAPDLLRLLREGEVTQRVAAAKALIHPRPTPPTVTALLAALKDPDPAVRMAVLTTIGFINRPSAEIIRPVASLLQDPDRSVVQSALRLLANLSFRAAVAAPNLRRLLTHEAPEIRSQAIAVLAPLVNVTQVASDALVEALDDPTPANRAAAAHGLAISGEVPAAAVPKLTALLSEEDENVRRRAQQALQQIQTAGNP
jgi:HEAT repeat protein